jgi:hypothetical protein
VNAKLVLVLGGALALAVLALGVLSQGTAGTARADPAPTPTPNTVTTGATVDGTGIAPNIECKWELPDVLSSDTDPTIQYGLDDDPDTVPDADPTTPGIQIPCDLQRDGTGNPIGPPAMPEDVHAKIQVKPNLEDEPEARRIQVWMAVDHPAGLGNIGGVYWDVFEGDGAGGWTHKVQLEGTDVHKVPTGPTGQCTNYGTGTDDPPNTMFGAAVANGILSADAVDDLNFGLVAKCQQNEKAFYYSEFELSKDQPCGEYKIIATAASGGLTDTLTNYIDIICVIGLQIDFSSVNWGSIVPGQDDQVSGNLLWEPTSSTAPTVKNVGNDGMRLKVHFSAMTGSTDPSKTIDSFDACFGRSPSTLQCFNTIAASTWKTFDADPARVLCANEVGKLDLSLHPPAFLPNDTYSGTLDLLGQHEAGKCLGDTHYP